MNKDTKTAFPFQNTLVSDTGLALQTVRSCIKRLEDHNAFKIEKEGRKNIYVFSKEENFEMFDFEFLNKEDLSLSEKGFIAKIQPHMFKDGQDGVIKYTYSELQDMTGLSISTILRANRSLEKKKYAVVELDKKIYHLDKIGQYVLCKLEQHEEDINKLKMECDMLKEELQELKQQLTHKIIL